jgi:hypothetical protein
MRFLHPKLARLVGTWTLVATSNLGVPLRSELSIDYSQVEFTTSTYVGPAVFQRTCYGRVVGTGARSDVVWLKLLDMRVDTGILPPIQIPAPPQALYRMRIHDVHEDDTSMTFTVKAADHSYTFCKTLVRARTEQPLLKLFATQLVFDYIIHLKDQL